jgi:hypothetical protein
MIKISVTLKSNGFLSAEAEDVLETSHNCLDDLWKLDDWVYPQHRMVHLMDIIAHAVTRFIQSKSSGMDLWKSPYNQVNSLIIYASTD